MTIQATVSDFKCVYDKCCLVWLPCRFNMLPSVTHRYNLHSNATEKLEAVDKKVTTLQESVDLLHVKTESILDQVLTIADRIWFGKTEIHEHFLVRPAKIRSLSLPGSVSDIDVGIGSIKPPVPLGKNEPKNTQYKLKVTCHYLRDVLMQTLVSSNLSTKWVSFPLK